MMKRKTVIIIVQAAVLIVLSTLFRLYSSPRVFQHNQVYFFGYDPPYHARRVHCFLKSLPWWYRTDYFSAFPYGLHDAWPPGFDYTTAVVAAILGYSNQNPTEIDTLCAMIPLMYGVLTVLFFFLMLRAYPPTRSMAFYAALLLAFLPAHVNITMMGRYDHHAVEPLLLFALFSLFIWWYDRPAAKNSPPLFTNVSGFSGVGLILAFCLYFWMGSVIFLALMLMSLMVQAVFDVKQKTFDFSRWLYISLSFIIAFGLIIPYYGTTKWALEKAFFSYYPSLFQPLLLLIAFLATLAIALIARRLNTAGNYSLLIFIYSSLGFVGSILAKFLAPSLYQSLVEGFYLLSHEDVWLSHTSESQSLFFMREFFSPQFAHINFGYGIYLFPFFFCITLYLLLKEQGAPQLFWTSLLISGLFFTFVTLSNKRYADFFALIFCFTLVYAAREGFWRTHRWLTAGFSIPKVRSRFLTFMLLLTVMSLLFMPGIRFYFNAFISPDRINYSTIPDYDMAMMKWIREHTPSIEQPFNAEQLPTYGIMAPNVYGHWLNYYALRPAMFSPFAVHFKRAAEVFMSQSIPHFTRYCEVFRIRYLLLNPLAMMIPQYTKLLKKNQIYIKQDTTDMPNGTKAVHLSLTEEYFSLICSRLYELDGNRPQFTGSDSLKALDRFRLIKDGPPIRDAGGQTIIPTKLFEFVTGAVLTGYTTPATKVTLSLPLSTDVKRAFLYKDTVRADSHGMFTFRVPYHTQPMPDDAVQAQGPYTVTLQKGDTIKCEVTEEEVQEGARRLITYVE